MKQYKYIIYSLLALIATTVDIINTTQVAGLNADISGRVVIRNITH